MHLFINNKYTKWYNSIIDKNRNIVLENQYYEKHHIIPKSMGGSNDTDNLVYVTPREHYILHILLTKMCIQRKHQESMYHALLGFTTATTKRILNSHQYELARKTYYSKLSEIHPMKGRQHSEESKQKISKANKGKKRSESFRNKRSEFMSIPENNYMSGNDIFKGENNPNYGKRGIDSPNFGQKRSEDFKKRLRESHIGKPKSESHKKAISDRMKENRSTCIHCGLSSTKNAITRYHNDKCKLLDS